MRACLQAEVERLGIQVRQARAEAAAAEQRAGELEWRLQRQEQSLVERAHMASEAKHATDMLSEVRQRLGCVGALCEWQYQVAVFSSRLARALSYMASFVYSNQALLKATHAQTCSVKAPGAVSDQEYESLTHSPDLLLQEGLRAVREKAGFLEAELRGQLADARAFLADERQNRRAAEAALATSEACLRRSLDSARAEAAALRHQVHMPAVPASLFKL